MRTLISICALTLLTSLTFAQQQPARIAVTGVSEVSLDPQFVSIHGSIKIVDKNSGAGYTQLLHDLSKFTALLIEQGVPKADIEKSSVSQGVEFSWQKGERKADGYYSSCDVKVNIKNLESQQKIYEVYSKISSMQISYTEYKRSDMEEQQNKQLQLALENAKKKASLMASTLGVKIGKPIYITEAGGAPMAAYIGMNRMEKSAAPEQEDFKGSLKIQSSVTVEFSLE